MIFRSDWFRKYRLIILKIKRKIKKSEEFNEKKLVICPFYGSYGIFLVLLRCFTTVYKLEPICSEYLR